MIRPVTCICFLLACGSGLYLYETKHRVTVLDQQIEKTVRATETTREQIRLLHADWTLLNQPDRLQKLAEQFLALKTTSPAQFTSLAELDSRLPPVPAPPVAPSVAPAPAPPPLIAAAEPPPPAVASRGPRIAEDPSPEHRNAAEHPPGDAAKPSRGTAPMVAVAIAPRPVPPIPRPRAPVIEAAARPVWAPRPVAAAARSYYSPPAPQPVMSSGSLLGMAHAAAGPPPPAPTPLGHWVNDGN